MRLRKRHSDSGQLRYSLTARGLAACFAAGLTVLAGLTWLALALLHSSAAGPAAAAAGPAAAAARPASAAAGPASPPVRVCGNNAILGGGPASPPRGAVVIPAGDDSGTVLAHNWTIRPDTTYWFAPGTHTLGTDQYSQIIPADGDMFIGAPGAILDGRGDNHYAFTGNASNVTIKYLTMQDFGVGSSATTPSGDNGGQGVVNHDSGRGWVMKYLTVQYDAGAGVFVGTDGILSYSCLRDNGEYGFQGLGRASGQFGATHLTIDHNEVTGNNTWNWENRNGACGCSGADKFWNAADVSLIDNYIHNNHGPGIWADTDNANFDVEGNYVSNNDSEAVIYETSYNLRLANNTFVRNALVDGPGLGGFPDPAVYISESGGDSRVPHSYGPAIEISGNRFTDNWGGVVLWENADRYCSSGANTSTGSCTLVNPSVATTSNCSKSSLIRTEPYYGGCRWKTQNVRVSGNDFIFDPASIGPDCTPAKYCGFNGIFSQWGSWQPYHGTVVENHITFDQNNHFGSNTYNGPWQFMVLQQGSAVSWETWRGTPYDQDADSTMNRRGA
jgi:parallel beta-helix repeat protein